MRKKLCSILLMCALVFGGIGVTQSKMTIVHAMPSVQVNSNTWLVSGVGDLQHELALVDQRDCGCGRHQAKVLIHQCIRENRTLKVVQILWQFHYSIM